MLISITQCEYAVLINVTQTIRVLFDYAYSFANILFKKLTKKIINNKIRETGAVIIMNICSFIARRNQNLKNVQQTP